MFIFEKKRQKVILLRFLRMMINKDIRATSRLSRRPGNRIQSRQNMPGYLSLIHLIFAQLLIQRLVQTLNDTVIGTQIAKRPSGC